MMCSPPLCTVPPLSLGTRGVCPSVPCPQDADGSANSSPNFCADAITNAGADGRANAVANTFSYTDADRGANSDADTAATTTVCAAS